jgi:tetratricopeptide (TPR) repeat protein
MQALSQAIDRGFAAHVTLATALKPLRGQPGFKTLVERHALNQAMKEDRMEETLFAYQRMGKFQAAADLLQGLHEASLRVFGPEHTKGLIFDWQGAYLKILLGRYAEAETDLRRLLADESTPAPVVGNYHWLMAECFAGQGRRTEALEEIDLAWQMSSNHWGGANDESAFLHYLRAGRRVLRGDRKGAIESLRSALQRLPLGRVSIEGSPLFRELHDDPEFRTLIASQRHPFLL